MSEAMDLLESDVERDLRATVRSLLGEACPPLALTALYDGDRSVVGPLWRSIATDLGLAALLVPEEHGGAGASAREASVVLEELGRAAAPVPFLTSAVIATTLLVELDDELLPVLAEGHRTAALAVPLPTAWDQPLPRVSVRDGLLDGVVTSIAGALDADVLLVLAGGADNALELYAVEAADAAIRPVVSFDMTRQLADIELAGTAGRLVGRGVEPAVRHALLAGTALLASEQLGVARWCLEATVAYVKERRQFGRPVGSFQAVKHRLADLYTQIESSAGAARYAATAVAAADEDSVIAASVAQACLSDIAVLAAEEAIQLHGGIGMTWEHPAHLYLKRAKADQVALGTPGSHRSRLAELVDLPPAPA